MNHVWPITIRDATYTGRRYDIAAIASIKRKHVKGSSVILPPVSVRLQTERGYYRALRVMLSGLARETNSSIMSAYRADRQQQQIIRRLRDAPESSWFQQLKSLAQALSRQTSATVNRILELESQRHSEEFMRIARRTLGIDLTAVVTQEDLESYLRLAASRNTSLITSLADDVVKRVEQDVYTSGVQGDSVEALKKRLTKSYGVADSRAQLIARDQTAKFNSDLNRIRQEQAGIDSYQWMTSHDERVRPLHKDLDGKQYEWGKATGAEQGLPPGQPIQCRCIARGIVEF